MNDNQFQWSLTALSILVILWIVLGIILGLSAVWTIIIGLIAWVVGGGTLLQYWGKKYMSQL